MPCRDQSFRPPHRPAGTDPTKPTSARTGETGVEDSWIGSPFIWIGVLEDTILSKSAPFDAGRI